MRLNLTLTTTVHDDTIIIKATTIKVPDKSSRMSLVMLAKKWASLTGVPSTTQPVDINTFLIHIPTANQIICAEIDRLDTTYADQLVMHENKGYVWYEREHAPKPHVSYRMKDNKQTLKGVWR